MNYSDFNNATIIKVLAGIYVGLIMGDGEEMKAEKHVTIWNLKKYCNPISFPTEKAT
jgi:hypothetical protein